MKFLSFILFGIGLMFTPQLSAQTTRVRGQVTDAANGEPMPYVSVVFPGTTVGITTDEQGIYDLETRDTSSYVATSMVGYAPQIKPIKRNAFNQVHFQLESVEFGIAQVVIRPGENPAHPILKGVIRHKSKNDPSRHARYKCQTYTKMELDLANIKGEFKSKRMQRNFGFVFNYVDTSSLTGQPYLPAMISETVADYYHSQSPAISREVIRASRVSGLDDSYSIAQFTGNLENDINFYDNFIELFNVRFASPLADSGLSFYDYFLVDSMEVKGRKTYKIRFHPKRVTTPVLDGEINIDSASYALQSASVRMPKKVNVNWIKHLRMENSNQMLNDSTWFRERDHIAAEFAIAMRDSAKMVTFIGQREVNYSDIELNAEIPPEIYRMDNDVVLADEDEINRRDEEFWAARRPYALSEKEKNIYSMVDSIQQAPLYRNIYTIINTIIGGYWNREYIGWGPYYKLGSFNKLEGFRMQLGARTTKTLSRKVRLGAYMAYGTKDETVKGGGSVELMFNRRLTRKLTLTASHDVMQLGAGNAVLTESNILSSILSRGGRQRLSIVNQGEAHYEHEWFHGFSNFLSFRYRKIHRNEYVPMIQPNGRMWSTLPDARLHVGLRFSHNEKIYRRAFDKNSLGSDYPIFTLDASAGFKGFMGSRFDYCRVEGSIHYTPKIPPIGYSKITVQGGKVFGHVPYLLLKLHEGNGTYFYDPFAFSCMNFYEFASDKWVSFFYEHHFNGWILGRIPLIKKLKWREVFVCKGVWGTLEERNNGALNNTQAPLLFPLGMTSVDKPYVEMGFGVENIFRLLRLDFIWRMTHKEATLGQDIQNFAVNMSVQLKF